MKQIIVSIVALLGLATLTPAIVLADTTQAVSAADKIKQGSDEVGGNENDTDIKTSLKSIINAILYVLGAAAVIVIIIAGFRYVTSNGDPGATKSAKDTILYAVIGIIVAILAYAIVNFAIGIFDK